MMTGDETKDLSPEAKVLFDLHGQGTPDSGSTKTKTPEEIITDQFDIEIIKWGGRINSMSSRMRDIGKCVDVQMDLYDYRHEVVDRKHKLLRDLAKFNKKYKEDRAKKLGHYATNFDRKLTAGEREKMVDSDTAKLKYIIDLLENHVNQMDQTFRLIENMIFGLKHRIDLEDYLRKM